MLSLLLLFLTDGALDDSIVRLSNLWIHALWLLLYLLNWMEREIIREKIDDSNIRRKFRIKRNERQKNFIELIIYIN